MPAELEICKGATVPKSFRDQQGLHQQNLFAPIRDRFYVRHFILQTKQRSGRPQARHDNREVWSQAGLAAD